MSRRSIAKQPPAPPPRPSKGLAPGDTVIVLSGIAEGARGILGTPWGEYSPGVPLWRVDLHDRHEHAIREDFLERAP